MKDKPKRVKRQNAVPVDKEVFKLEYTPEKESKSGHWCETSTKRNCKCCKP